MATGQFEVVAAEDVQPGQSLGRIALFNADGTPWTGGGEPAAVTWASITGKPSTFAPIVGSSATQAAAGNHNHPVTADAGSGLAAAATVQALAVALSTRIKALEDETP